MSHLYVYIKNEEQRRKMYEVVKKSRGTDSGVDIPMPESVLVPAGATYKLGLGIVVAATTRIGTAGPCLLFPRSSISKTSLRLANSIGLIDAGYRGEVCAVVDNLALECVQINAGDRLFQIVTHDFLPFSNIMFVDSLEQMPEPPDDRGAGGFGSTGR